MSTLEELVTVKMTRMELYQILDAAITKNDTFKHKLQRL